MWPRAVVEMVAGKNQSHGAGKILEVILFSGFCVRNLFPIPSTKCFHSVVHELTAVDEIITLFISSSSSSCLTTFFFLFKRSKIQCDRSKKQNYLKNAKKITSYRNASIYRPYSIASPSLARDLFSIDPKSNSSRIHRVKSTGPVFVIKIRVDENQQIRDFRLPLT